MLYTNLTVTNDTESNSKRTLIDILIIKSCIVQERIKKIRLGKIITIFERA